MLLLRDVKKSFVEPDGSPLPILDIEEFHVAPGEQMVLVGKSGCGKTTLLHVIAGITRPDAGKVRINDWDITLMPEAECDRFRAEHIGYVFQTFNLLRGFSALENVMLAMRFARLPSETASLPAQMLGTVLDLFAGLPLIDRFTARMNMASPHVDRTRAVQLLERVGLGHRMTHKPMHLSVGEQQRVAVARALANRPKLLLADEPTANVDAGHQQQILDLLREACREEKVTLVLVTHSPLVAEQFDRVERLEEFNRVSKKMKEEGDLRD
jgi:ABC-type lipoprotein export system ATPase subunit